MRGGDVHSSKHLHTAAPQVSQPPLVALNAAAAALIWRLQVPKGSPEAVKTNLNVKLILEEQSSGSR
jgi:hypothetical protein